MDLLDEHRKHSKNGQADITDYIPAGMKAKSGYGNGAWDTTPSDTVSGQEDVVYTYKYTRTGGGGSVKYTLTYESNGGTEYKKETYNRNTTVDIDKKPVKDG